jgi:hypothetical protein
MVAAFFKIAAILIALAYLIPALSSLGTAINKSRLDSASERRRAREQRFKVPREAPKTRLVSFEVRRDG